MKRFFRKSSSSGTKEEQQRSSSSPSKQEGKDSPEELLNEDTTEEMRGKPEDDNAAKRRGSGDYDEPQSSLVHTSAENIGQGDGERSERHARPRKERGGRARAAEMEERESSEKLISSSRKISSNFPGDIGDSREEARGATKPRPIPRRTKGSTSLFTSGGSEDSEEEEEDEKQEEFEEILPARDSSSRKSPKGAKKETKIKTDKKIKGQLLSATGKIAGRNDPRGRRSTGDAVEFVSLKNITNVPKVDTSEAGGHYFSTVYNCKEPVSSFKVRARLLKYPTFSNQELWNEEKMAVVDDRVFEWQEKVFSKYEVKRYQKLENCITEQERKYHKQLSTPTHGKLKKLMGNYLYSYVTDDLYVTKKRMKLLTRKCPVPHTRKEKSSYSNRLTLDTSTRSLNSEGDSFDMGDGGGGGEENVYSDDDSIDFDEPMSSSTPMPSRKSKDNKNTSATEIAKAEKKARQKKEKELRDLEKRNSKLKEISLKKEKDDEKRRQQEEAKVSEKVRKLEAIETKEKELKAAYMQKYKYNKRPSMPLGARMRSVRLTPSPRKLNRRKKSQTISRSSEISDLQDEEENDEAGSLDSLRKVISGSGEAASSKVGTEMDTRKYSLGKVATSSKDPRKFYDRAESFKNAQSMFIMATIPCVPGRYREVVVCMIQSVPGQQRLLLKPGFGYRNIEAKRNTVFRISCELYEAPDVDHKDKQAGMKRKSLRDSSSGIDADIYGDVGFFENVPKNELRLLVFGEISSAEGFDESPLCIYYAIDIPKGWRNDSLQSNTEGMTHTCFTNHEGLAHFSHEFSFQLVFSLDFLDEPNRSTYPTPVIALMAVSMNHPSPRIVYEGYGYVSVPMTPGCHFVKTRMWKPRPRTIIERMRATFLDITPSLQDMKLVHFTGSESSEDCSKANLIGLQTEPSGTIKIRLNVIHQTPTINKEYESNLDLLEKMSSATIIKSVQAVIHAFQRARQKAETLKSQYD